MHDYMDTEIDVGGFKNYLTVDLCGDCMIELEGLIYKFVNREVSKEG